VWHEGLRARGFFLSLPPLVAPLITLPAAPPCLAYATFQVTRTYRLEHVGEIQPGRVPIAPAIACPGSTNMHNGVPLRSPHMPRREGQRGKRGRCLGLRSWAPEVVLRLSSVSTSVSPGLISQQHVAYGPMQRQLIGVLIRGPARPQLRGLHFAVCDLRFACFQLTSAALPARSAPGNFSSDGPPGSERLPENDRLGPSKSSFPRAKEALQKLCRQCKRPSKLHAFSHRLLGLPVTEADRGDPTNHPLALHSLVRTSWPAAGAPDPVPEEEPSRRDFLALFRAFYPGTSITSKPPRPILDVFWNSAGSMFADYMFTVPV